LKVAALYDIHGNLHALDAVLAELRGLRPDVVLVGGDVVAGPFPREVLARLRALGEPVRFIRGNADREVAARVGETAAAPAVASADTWGERAAWAAARLSLEDRAFLSALSLTLALEVDGLGATLFCHATPRSDEEIVTRATPEARVAEALAGVGERLVVCGHTHVQYDRAVAGRRLVNAGSVGLAYEGRPAAFWTLLGPGVEPRQTPYDHEAAAEAVRELGFPGAEDYAARFLLAPPDAEQATAFLERLAEERRRAARD
jgi:predicted phosphodiesterase